MRVWMFAGGLWSGAWSAEMAAKVFESIGKLGLGLAVAGGVVNSALYNGEWRGLGAPDRFVWSFYPNPDLSGNRLRACSAWELLPPKVTELPCEEQTEGPWSSTCSSCLLQTILLIKPCC